jgi:hypothetical protein
VKDKPQMDKEAIRSGLIGTLIVWLVLGAIAALIIIFFT